MKLLQNINDSAVVKNEEFRSISSFASKVAFTKKALLYIKDNIRTERLCEECVQEPEIDPLTNPFVHFWNETDIFIGELLVNATVSLKALEEGDLANKYRTILFCKAQRLFDGVSVIKLEGIFYFFHSRFSQNQIVIFQSI